MSGSHPTQNKPPAVPLPTPSDVPHVVFKKGWAETVGFALAFGVTVFVVVFVFLSGASHG